MEDQDKSDGWDEGLEEADELAYLHKDPLRASLFRSGTSRRRKSEKKPKFSIRGYFAAFDVKTENLYIGEQEGASGEPPTKASETMVAELSENIEEETEDLPPEFALPTKKANTSVSELLEDLQGRSGSSVRTPFLLHQHAPNSAIREQEVSSGVPPTKASQTLKAELLGNIKEATEDLRPEAGPIKKANISVAELLEDLQGRTGSSVGTTSSLRQHVRGKDWKPKLPTSGKKTLAILGERSLHSEDPLEHVIDGTSSEEEEEVIQNYLALVNKDVKRQTMTDLFQEAFNPTNMEGTMLPMRSTGAGYYGRIQQIIQMEKDRHAEFSRQYNKEQGDSKGITLQIMSRSLEGKLTVCRCLFQEKSNFTSKASTGRAMDESRTKRTIIFSPKICDNVDLLVGNIIHIFPPWKEVEVQEENVILCTYFSHQGA